MKKIATLLILWSLCAPLLHSQSLTFTRNYGGAPYDDARSVVATPDGGFVFTGLHQDQADPDGNMYLTKVNAAGAVLWSRQYLRPKEDGGNHLLRCSDGGFLVTGHTALSYGESCDGFVVKTDQNGLEQWRSFVGAALDDVCDAAVELPGAVFLVAGRMQEPETRQFRMLLAKIGPQGRVLFQKTIPAEVPSVAYSMALSTDQKLYLAGFQYSPNGGPNRMLLVKCELDGTVLWSRDWGSELNERARSVLPTPDGGCYVVGGAHNALEQSAGMRVLRFDAEGSLLASSEVLQGQEPAYLYSATLSAEGGLAVAGVLQTESGGSQLPFLARLDADLNLLDWQALPMSGNCRTRCIAQHPSGGYVLGGNQYLEADQSETFIAVVRAPAASTPVRNAVETPSLLFPNPFRDFTYLKIGAPGAEKTLCLFSADGRLLRNVTFTENEYFLQRGDLPAGVYWYSVVDAAGRRLAFGKLGVME